MRGPRRAGKVLPVLPRAVYLEFPESAPEPRVVAISPPDAIRLPNSVVTAHPREGLEPGAHAEAGEGYVTASGLEVRITRWWDPSPVFGPLSRARLDHGTVVLARHYQTAEHASGLAGHDGPADWLGAAATCYAEQRTTALATALLYCAASGQAAAEVSAVLLGMAGQEP